jgi:hypothetical protein
MPTTHRAPTWDMRPVPSETPPSGTGRWAVVSLPTMQWVAFGDEAQCRQLVTRLITRATALLAD